MDSLLSSYASSDEEGEDNQQLQEPPPISSALASKPASQHTQPTFASKSSSLFTSLPQPKSSSLFQSLPQPKSKQTPSLPNPLNHGEGQEPTSQYTQTNPKASSFFSSLPRPKSQNSRKPISNSSSSDLKAKRVVLFKPPIAPPSTISANLDDDDDEDEEEERKRRKESESMAAQTPSVKSFLSSIPAPRNSATLGVLPSSGTGRRAIVETGAPASSTGGSRAEDNSGTDPNSGHSSVNYDSYVNYDSGIIQDGGNYDTNYDTYADYQSGVDPNANEGVQSQYGMSSEDNMTYGDYQNYGNYGAYGQSGSNWAHGSVPEMSGTSDGGVRVPGKRGRNEVPAEIVEVKQDELMKNRPREDQAKLTGIAFGPSYQPVSTKGKPSKLHKRKHQIGSLFFDMKQKEMELSERRAKGFLTKAETQAKYGW